MVQENSMARVIRELLEEERAKAKGLEQKIATAEEKIAGYQEQLAKVEARIPALEALTGTLENQLMMPMEA